MIQLVFAAVLSASRVSAQAGAQAPCPAPRSAQEVLDCALKNHPALRRAAAAQAQASYLEPAALQRPNPELDALGRFGKKDGDRLNKDEVTLFHTIEAGGKRSARAAKARADRAAVDSDALKAREDVVLEVISSLYRLRQARAEGGVLDRTISSLSAIQKRLRARPRLTPDQESTLEVFRLAESETQLRRAGLSGEETALVRALELATGGPFEAADTALPPPKETWPELPDVAGGPPSGSQALRAQAELDAATADLRAARGAAYPDIRVGPTLERESEGAVVKQTYGLALGLPLPLYHRNRAGRDYAALGVQAAEAGALAARTTLAAERQAELGRYKAAVAALGAIPRAKTGSEARRTEELFDRGLIPSSMLLEAYRQAFEIAKTRNETELSAIRALWRIYAIEGRVASEKL